MAPTLPASQAAFLATCIEALLYGATAMLFCSTLAILLKTRSTSSFNKPILLAICLMMTLATIHLALDITNGFMEVFDTASVASQDSDSIICQMGSGRALCMIGSVATMAQLLLGDAVNLYRLWLVWDRSWRPAAVPAILYLLSLVSACLNLTFLGLSTSSRNTRLLNISLIAFGIIGLVQPTVTTGLIILQLCLVEKRASAYRAVKLFSFRPIIRMIIDSAATYVVALAFVCILWLADPTAYAVAMTIMVPIVPLTFCGLTTRIGVHSLGVRLAAARDDSDIPSPLPNEVNQLSYGPESSFTRTAVDTNVGAGIESELEKGTTSGQTKQKA